MPESAHICRAPNAPVVDLATESIVNNCFTLCSWSLLTVYFRLCKPGIAAFDNQESVLHCCLGAAKGGIRTLVLQISHTFQKSTQSRHLPLAWSERRKYIETILLENVTGKLEYCYTNYETINVFEFNILGNVEAELNNDPSLQTIRAVVSYKLPILD